jgi:hypothetical protein
MADFLALSDFEPSERLLGLMEALTPQQRRAVPRIVEALMGGEPLTGLLKGEGKICAWKTYYQKPRGWAHQETFQAALQAALREYDQARLQVAVRDAAERMRRATPLAAELAEATVRACLTGEAERVPPPIWHLLVEMGAVEGKVGACKDSDAIRAASVLLSKGLQAALGILDRADIQTAVKSTGSEADLFRRWIEELRAAGDEDDGDRWDPEDLANVAAEGGDVPPAGVRAESAAETGAPEQGAGGPGGGWGAERQE